MRLADLEVIGVGLGSLVLYLITADGLVVGAVVTLWLVLKLVWTDDRLFALPMALTFQWSQTVIGLFYFDLTGRAVPAIDGSDYRPMVMIGLGCVLALAAGIRLGFYARKRPNPHVPRPDFAFALGPLVIAYLASIFIEGTLITISPYYPTFRQIIVTLDTARLGLLFLFLRRLCSGSNPQWGLMGLVVFIEVLMGITGFFAGFREPIVLAVLAVLEIFNTRNVRHWLAVGVAIIVTSTLALVWMGIRSDYRRDYVEVDQFSASRNARVARVGDLTSNFFKSDSSLWNTADLLVDRMWTIYYPALAVARVPSVMPHTDGAILRAALTHIMTPRVFFPDKPELQSDSEEVRKYANVRVAGRESNTSIAFGYSAEAYIDYGLPMMFLPVFVFGMFIGAMYALFRSMIWHRELLVAFCTVAFWLSVYLFERSWATMLGTTLGFMVYLGPPVVLLDRFLLVRVAANKTREENPQLFDAPIFRDHA